MASPVEAQLPDPAIISLVDRNDVAVDAHLLASARKMPESTDDVAANRCYVLVLPLQTRQIPLPSLDVDGFTSKDRPIPADKTKPTTPSEAAVEM